MDFALKVSFAGKVMMLADLLDQSAHHQACPFRPQENPDPPEDIDRAKFDITRSAIAERA